MTRKLLVVEVNETIEHWLRTNLSVYDVPLCIHELPTAEELGRVAWEAANGPSQYFYERIGAAILDALTKRRTGGDVK